MLNGEMIRINTIDKINLGGYIVKLVLYVRTTEEKWKNIMSDFKTRVESALTDKRLAAEIKVLQSNNTDKCNFQVPPDDSFPSLHRLMDFCYNFCQDIKMRDEVDLQFVALRTNLEQTFLAYAAHQKVNEQGNAR